MRMQRNFYEVLGVPRNATKKEIKEKYYTLARKYHPDRAKDKQLADKLFVQINRAYSTLFNDIKREKYDAGLDVAQSLPPMPSAAAPRQSSASQTPPPQQVTGQQIRDWFDQASKAQLRQDFTAASELCSKVLDADPSNFGALVLMGDIFAQTGKQNEALDMYERGLSIQPTNRALREKAARLHSVVARRAANPQVGKPSSNGAAQSANSQPAGQRPPLTAHKAPPLTQKPPTQSVKPAAKPQPKSLLDRLINRK